MLLARTRAATAAATACIRRPLRAAPCTPAVWHTRHSGRTAAVLLRVRCLWSSSGVARAGGGAASASASDDDWWNASGRAAREGGVSSQLPRDCDWEVGAVSSNSNSSNSSSTVPAGTGAAAAASSAAMFHTTAPRTATDATALDHDGSAESAAEGARLAVLNAAAATAAADATGAIIGASGSSGGSLLATTYHQALDSRTDVDLERERELQDGDGVFEAAANKRNDKNPFRLSANFLERYKDVKPPFGFNGLGELVYQRTYSRRKADGTKEQWGETVERVVNGTYNMQKRWIEQHQLGWNPWRAQRSAQEMYDRIFNMKFLPPGRGLWAMGSPITEDRQLYAALNNCAFVSTSNLRDGPARPFCFLMDAAMLGVGVGFDTAGAGDVIVKGFNSSKPAVPHSVGDSREGWVASVRLLIDALILGRPQPEFDYSLVRPAGAPIRGFGGVASGPGALQQLHEDIVNILSPLTGEPVSVTAIVDIMNVIGRCVVSGNVRQTAEIAFGDPKDEEYIDLKDYDVNPHRAEYGWTSNNSVLAELGMDYHKVVDRIVKNGEPGFAWLENMRQYGLMHGEPDYKDGRAAGGNPCLEQTLESYELCCLVETFPNNHSSLEDYKRTLKYAYLYAKTVTLGRTHWPVTNRVMLRNRRIGCSMSGIAQFISQKGLHELRKWCVHGYHQIHHYDQRYSDWLAIPRSIKTTCVKPSGTVSLLAGATPGMHYPESRYYIRRVRMPAHSEVVQPLLAAGYHLEPAVSDSNTLIVSIPVDVGEGVRTASELSMWEQLSLAAFLQKYWADNQVSCTVSFDPETEARHLPHALDYFQYHLKGVSFLPRTKTGAYAQMPYEAITEEAYYSMLEGLEPLDFAGMLGADAVMPDKFCDAPSCEVPS